MTAPIFIPESDEISESVGVGSGPARDRGGEKTERPGAPPKIRPYWHREGVITPGFFWAWTFFSMIIGSAIAIAVTHLGG